MNKAMMTPANESKLTSDALSRANSDLINLIAATNVGVIFLDALLQVRRFTPRATELFQLMASDIGRPFAQIAHSIRADALGRRPLELVTQVCATAAQLEEVVQGDNGGWYILRFFPYRTLDNLIDGVVITLIDITERKATEEALRAHSQRLQLALDAGKMGTYTWHVLDNTFVLDAQWAALFGQPPQPAPLASRPFLDQIHPTDRAHVVATLNDFVATGSAYQLEYRIYWPDGSQRWLSSRGQAIRNGAGVTTRVEGISWDITERKQNEEQLAFSAYLLENIQDAVIAFDLDYRITAWSQGAALTYGYTAAEALGQSVLDLVRPTIGPAQRRQRLAAMDKSTAIRVETVHHRRDGTPVAIEAISVALLGKNELTGGYLSINRDITARKRAEEALRQSEARYRTLFETMDEGFCIFEMLFDEQDKPIDYRFLEGNPAFARFTGLAHAIGKTARELVPNLEAHWFEIYGKVALSGEPLRFVQESAAMGRWFEIYAFRFGAAENRQVALLFTNITDRKQAEDQLRRQEELLRQIADNVPGLIGYMGSDECYRFVNATFETWFCRPRHQIIGGTVLDLMGEDEHARLRGYRQQALAGEHVSYETDFLYPDGVTRTVWGRYQPHFAADGAVIGFYLFVMDISERKQAEQALLESEKRFRAFFELAAVGAAQVDLNNKRFTAVNDKFCALTGYTQAELAQLSFVELTHPDDRAHAVQMLLQRDAGIGDEYRVEKRYLRKDGSVVWVDLASNLIRNTAGRPLYSIAVVVDITERKAAEQALLQFNEQLEQQVKARTAELTKRLQELDQFAYVASHDLRAPLRAIDHLAQWIRDDAGDRLAPASLDHLEKMRGRIMRMENLLSDLLAYSRADRYQYNIGKVDVALLIDEITRLVTPPQGFAVNITTALPIFITYKVPLETVLRNLIQNAIKHHDRADGQVQVAVADQGEFFEFSISDDGPGIPPKFHERIFQIFQTLKPRDQVEGSGMGLAIVKKAVEHYGGRVRVESDGQRGATFAFTWPKELPST